MKLLPLLDTHVNTVPDGADSITDNVELFIFDIDGNSLTVDTILVRRNDITITVKTRDDVARQAPYVRESEVEVEVPEDYTPPTPKTNNPSRWDPNPR